MPVFAVSEVAEEPLLITLDEAMGTNSFCWERTLFERKCLKRIVFSKLAGPVSDPRHRRTGRLYLNRKAPSTKAPPSLIDADPQEVEGVEDCALALHLRLFGKRSPWLPATAGLEK